VIITVGASDATINFTDGVIVRYINPLGHAGNATRATITSPQHASLRLVGDVPNNMWHVLDTYGQITFFDPAAVSLNNISTQVQGSSTWNLNAAITSILINTILTIPQDTTVVIPTDKTLMIDVGGIVINNGE
jgi:hypothetical protein